MIKCGLATLAEKAAKMGYKNPNGTVNLFMAQEVINKFGKLVPKSELSSNQLKEIEAASKKILEKLNKPDSFVKNTTNLSVKNNKLIKFIDRIFTRQKQNI